MLEPSIRALTTLAIVLGGLVVMTGGCHRPDPNTPEGRAQIERNEEKKRAKAEAKERKRSAHENATQTTPATETQPEPTTSPSSTPAAASATPVATGGTCNASCEHYLRCKNLANNADAQQKCVSACATMKLTPQQLSGFEQTDCANAIAIVENQNTGQNRPAPKTSNACSGCVWDGSSCIWMSSGNWGAGPYSGAYSACDAACCRRR